MLFQKIRQAQITCKPAADTTTYLTPLTTVEELRKCFFKKSKNRKARFLNLARNKRFLEATAKAIFEHLDVNKNGYLNLKEMKPVFDVIIRRAAQLVMGFSWGLGFVVKKQSKKIFKNKILPFSSKQEGADLFNLMVLIRNSLLYCAGGNSKYDIDDISTHFYKVGSIDYNIVHQAQIPTGIPEIKKAESADIRVSDQFPEAITSDTSSVSNGESQTSEQSTGSEQIRAVLNNLSGRMLLA